jgi:CBS domain containing-hemolysin-like protein
MIEGVMELDDANVGDVMTPASEMDLIPVEMDWDQMLQYAVQVGHTRIPVYEGRPENIVGILYVKDLLAELAKPEVEDRRPLRQLLRKAIHVPKSTRLDELLKRFLEERKHLFIVVDEYLNLAGLVTIEDVLEEIVGEIIDESDEEEEKEVQVIDDNCAIVLARAHVETVNEEMGIALPHDQDFDTMGGFVLRQLGRVPAAGESFLWNDVHVAILEANPRRVEKVKLTVLAGAQS